MLIVHEIWLNQLLLNNMKKITVIGGGTGTTAVLSGLKQYSDLELSVIVSMTDDGGSNAVVRDQFGLLPLSDVRKSIIALAETDSQLLRELFTYRFAKGEGLSGHTLGNLMMMAATDISGSEEMAIQRLSTLFNVKGQVIPVTLEQTRLVAEYESGQQVKGEHLIDEPDSNPGRIKNLTLSDSVVANPAAVVSIQQSDVIIIGPGDLYTSTLANLIVPGIAEAIKKSQAQIIFINNLMTKRGQTEEMSAADLLNEITRYVGREPNITLIHNQIFPDLILQKYAARNEYPIVDDLTEVLAKRADLADDAEAAPDQGDTLVRSLIRHNPNKLGKVLRELIG